MKRCPKCNAEYGDGATYCETCGVKLVKPCVCPHCGAEVSEGAMFCAKCGKPVNEVVSAEQVRTESSKIEQYKRELAAYKSKKASLLITGSILLAVGLTMFILFLVLFNNLVYTESDYDLVSKGYLYIFFAVVGELVLDAGVALMIVAGAVFSKKISNRERIIRESENR